MDESTMHFPQTLKRSGQWLFRTFVASTVLRDLTVLIIMAAGAFAGYKVYLKIDRVEHGYDVLATDMRVRNEQYAIREIIEQRLPNLSPDQQSRMAFEIFEACHRHENYPPYIVLGLIATESGFNVNAQGGDAIGLMQIRPSSAMAHFRALGVAFSLESLRDPVMNVTIGLRILFDNQDAAVLSGKSPRGQYVRGLYDYNGGGEPYARKVLTAAVPFQKQLDAPLQGHLKDLEVAKPAPVL